SEMWACKWARSLFVAGSADLLWTTGVMPNSSLADGNELMGKLKPYVWNLTQNLLGSPEFKRTLYSSVLRPPGRLLDFGCATGHIAEAFLDFEYYGVDLDPKAIETARARFESHE